MASYYSFNTLVELVCFLFALTCLFREEDPKWKSMILLMFCIFLAETFGVYVKGIYMLDPVNVRPNTWIYNLLLIVQAALISRMFAGLFKGYHCLRLLIVSCLSLLAVFYIVELFDHGAFKKHVVTYVAMSVMFVAYSFMFFYLLLKDESPTDLRFDANFWWVAGTLFFFFGSIMVTLFHQTIRDNLPHQHYIKYIYNTLNVMLYGCWSYAFILRKWSTQKFVTSL